MELIEIKNIDLRFTYDISAKSGGYNINVNMITTPRKGQVPELFTEKQEKRKATFTQLGSNQQATIIGSWLASLSCVWDLANLDFKPVVFEKTDVAN